MWGTFLSEPLRIVALVGLCPAALNRAAGLVFIVYRVDYQGI